MPMAKSQLNGSIAAARSDSTTNNDGAEERAVEAAGAAEDQHDQHVARHA